MNTVAAYNIKWGRSTVTWVMHPGWAETIWSIEVMAPGLVSNIFLIDTLECFHLVLHDLLWDLTNMKARGEFLDIAELPGCYLLLGYSDEVF